MKLNNMMTESFECVKIGGILRNLSNDEMRIYKQVKKAGKLFKADLSEFDANVATSMVSKGLLRRKKAQQEEGKHGRIYYTTRGRTGNLVKGKLEEVAPPSKKSEEWIKKNKKRFKEKYGKDYGKYLYGKAWNNYNGKVNESYQPLNETVYSSKYKTRDLFTYGNKRTNIPYSWIRTKSGSQEYSIYYLNGTMGIPEYTSELEHVIAYMDEHEIRKDLAVGAILFDEINNTPYKVIDVDESMLLTLHNIKKNEDEYFSCYTIIENLIARYWVIMESAETNVAPEISGEEFDESYQPLNETVYTAKYDRNQLLKVGESSTNIPAEWVSGDSDNQMFDIELFLYNNRLYVEHPNANAEAFGWIVNPIINNKIKKGDLLFSNYDDGVHKIIDTSDPDFIVIQKFKNPSLNLRIGMSEFIEELLLRRFIILENEEELTDKDIKLDPNMPSGEEFVESVQQPSDKSEDDIEIKGSDVESKIDFLKEIVPYIQKAMTTKKDNDVDNLLRFLDDNNCFQGDHFRSIYINGKEVLVDWTEQVRDALEAEADSSGEFNEYIRGELNTDAMWDNINNESYDQLIYHYAGNYRITEYLKEILGIIDNLLKSDEFKAVAFTNSNDGMWDGSEELEMPTEITNKKVEPTEIYDKVINLKNTLTKLINEHDNNYYTVTDIGNFRELINNTANEIYYDYHIRSFDSACEDAFIHFRDDFEREAAESGDFDVYFDDEYDEEATWDRIRNCSVSDLLNTISINGDDFVEELSSIIEKILAKYGHTNPMNELPSGEEFNESKDS